MTSDCDWGRSAWLWELEEVDSRQLKVDRKAKTEEEGDTTEFTEDTEKSEP